MSRNIWAVVGAAVVGLAAGCGGSTSGVAIDEGGKAALEDLAQMLQSLSEQGRKPPARLADLAEVEPLIPVAGPAIRSGDVVYVWGAPYAAGSNQVVAYEKKAPTDGGYVLLQDGTVKKMTADDFKSAPQAKK